MKRTVVTILAVVGALALSLQITYVAVNTLFPGYEEEVRRTFGTAEAINDITALYAQVEAAKDDPALKVMSDDWPAFPVVRRIPKGWLPKRFTEEWGNALNQDRIFWGDVLAYYDTSGELLGLEFYGSRYGCFASRQATVCPPSFQSLHRLAEGPLYVTARVTGDGD